MFEGCSYEGLARKLAKLSCTLVDRAWGSYTQAIVQPAVVPRRRDAANYDTHVESLCPLGHLGD